MPTPWRRPKTPRSPTRRRSSLGNDTDVDGDTLTIASVTSGTGGTAVLNANGTVTFTPAANFHGAASFSYTVSDGTATSNPATVTVNVTAVNHAPVANADTLAATEDTAVTYTAAQLVGNDTDVDGDTLSIASVTSGTRRHRGSQRQRHRHLHPGCQLPRRGQFQLHGERRHRDQQPGDGHRQRDGGQPRPGGQCRHPGGDRRHRGHLHGGAARRQRHRRRRRHAVDRLGDQRHAAAPRFSTPTAPSPSPRPPTSTARPVSPTR